ncbi:MAG: hypothetical protein ACJAYU_000829 [Bradymonadia bacterium]|jgi:hypothetical protein
MGEIDDDGLGHIGADETPTTPVSMDEPQEAAPEAAAHPQPEAPETPVPRPHLDPDDTWVAELIAGDELLAELALRAEELRMQVVVGEIVRDPDGEPLVVQFHPYRLDADYVYPASAIKTLGAVAALQVFEELAERHTGLTVDTRIEYADLATNLIDAAGEQVIVSEEDRTALREQLERALVVSSNQGFNRLWDIAGHDGINERAWEAGLESVRFHHRLSRQGLPEEAHRRSPAIRAELDDRWVELLPERISETSVASNMHADVAIGDAHIAALTDEHLDGPLDFSRKNGCSILDMLLLVAWVADPRLAPSIDLGINEAHREVLLEIMSRVPEESARFKPFSPGISEVVGWESLTYVNKAGRAYGFHLDAAYVSDVTNGREFLLAAAIHTNPNGVMNDSSYDYEGTSFPFLVALGEAVARRLLE